MIEKKFMGRYYLRNHIRWEWGKSTLGPTSVRTKMFSFVDIGAHSK